MWSEEFLRLLEPDIYQFGQDCLSALTKFDIYPINTDIQAVSDTQFTNQKGWEELEMDTVQWECGDQGNWTLENAYGREQIARPCRGDKPAKWENFVVSLGRAMKKSIRICMEIKAKGVQKTMRKYEKLHLQRKKNAALVSFQISNSSKRAFLELYAHYCEISKQHSLSQFAHTWSGPIHTDGHSRSSQFSVRPEAKTWSFAYQKQLYASVGLRKYYYFFVQFLDYFGESGEGVQLCSGLNIAVGEPKGVKIGLLFQYIRELGLEPYDGKAFSPVFYIERY